MSFFDPQPVPTPYTPPAPAVAPPAPPAGPQDYYSKLLGNDPQLQATLASIASLGDSYKTGFGTNLAQLLEQYGAVPDQIPDSLKPFLGDTVKGLADAATSSGVSTLAQLARAADIQHQHSISSLAARGIIHSGALGQHENEDLQNANLARANALSTLLGNISGAQQTYLGQQQSLEGQREGAANDALNRLYQQIQGGLIAAPGGSGTPTTPGGTKPAAPTPKLGPYKPFAVAGTPNPTGLSARNRGGIFSIH